MCGSMVDEMLEGRASRLYFVAKASHTLAMRRYQVLALGHTILMLKHTLISHPFLVQAYACICQPHTGRRLAECIQQGLGRPSAASLGFCSPICASILK